MNSVLRLISVLVVMAVVGLLAYTIGVAGLRKRGAEESAARSRAREQAKRYSLIAAFLYMVAMVSVAGLFL